jgi:hypothetical protein
MTNRISLSIVLAAFIATGCGPNEGVLRSGKESPSQAVAREVDGPSFESELAEIRNANFTWLYVVRRRDGGILNGEDKALVRQHTTDANRRVLSDEGKAVIIGSNYSITVEGVGILKERFEVLDLSPPPAPKP